MSKKPRTPAVKRPAVKRMFRKLDGILLLDKPQGLSSNQALQRVRHLFRAEKAGHTGSLDPLATGLLPVCFGEATKIAGLLLGSRKAYETTAELGLTTDSDDADGAPLLQRDVPELDDARIEAALAPLRGPIRQRAPIFSALKQGGEPLYAKARRGETIEAPERDVVVHDLRLLSRDRNRLCLQVETGLAGFPRVVVDAAQAHRLGQGQRLRLDGVTPAELVAIHDETGRILGLGEIDSDLVLRPGRLFTWTTEAAVAGLAGCLGSPRAAARWTLSLPGFPAARYNPQAFQGLWKASPQASGGPGGASAFQCRIAF